MLRVARSRPWRTLRTPRLPPPHRRTVHTPPPKTITVLSETYPTDDYTNLPPTIAALLPRKLHTTPPHPLNTLRKLIAAHFTGFTAYDDLPAVVTPELNFDSLGFPLDHPGRARGQSYYINRGTMLRTHTSAHEVDIYRQTPRSGGWLCTADVYRRDEIDRSHYPAFHQTEGARLVDVEDMDTIIRENNELRGKIQASNIIMDDCADFDPLSNPLQSTHLPETVLPVAQNLRLRITTLFLSLFPQSAHTAPLHVRWTPDLFPWTSPSYQLEVRFHDAWLELLGCGIVLDSTLQRGGHDPSVERSWAFGMGLERIAMPLFDIPDIRLFWSQDPRFWQQFKEGEVSAFKEFSKYPPVERDIAFFLPLGVGKPGASAAGGESQGWEENDLWDLIREVGGDLVESVKLVDDFWHEGRGRRSLMVRVCFRSMERSLERGEVNVLAERVKGVMQERLGVEIR